MWDIERIGVDAAADLAALWATTFEQAYCDVHTPENIAAYCADNFSIAQAEAALRAPETVCKFARTDDGVAGFYLVSHKPCPSPLEGGSSELKQIYLLASAYGTGVGKALFDDAVAEIASAGRDWVWLAVSDKNKRAQAFYAKLGFHAHGGGPDFNVGRDRLTSTLMARRVEAAP